MSGTYKVELVFMLPKQGTTCSKKVVVECPEECAVASSCSKPASSPCDESSCSKPVSNPCGESSCSKPMSNPCGQSCCSKPMSNPCEESCPIAAGNPCGESCLADPDETFGIVTRNPFFNFLRDYRKCHQNLLAKEIAKDGAKQWRCMSEQEKSKYIVQAFHTPKKYYGSRMKASIGESESMESMEH